ncbi:stage V sporulation protein S [Alteribacter lacisalsi]|uniref:Stage V sporulation protein S n=1 Tax=Alteribacter lacisalsi TaxID=2045244 RepID=A0A2W0HJ56_9BACI|nr:lasso peptide biosynthesis B2 protein [Alteribacter lacisalsi]PYZ97042.1 stage V sporulation protein S [Alteribacter lacisalsi]
MNGMSKIKALRNLDGATAGILAEAYGFLAYARILKLLPFSKVAPSLGETMKETPADLNLQEKRTIARVSQAVHMMSRYAFWESECLVKAVAAQKMLSRRGVDTTLYLGTGKDETGKLAAHAWLRSGPFFVSGAEGKEKFTVVATYAKTSDRRKVRGASYG